MRMPRTVIAVLAFCLVGLVPIAAPSSASASETSARAETASVEQAAKPRRTVKFAFKKDGRRYYKFIGKVQAAKNKKVTLMRSNTKKGKYRPFRSGRTNARGNFSWGNQKALGWFYVKVPSDKKYATSYSQLIHVYLVR